MVTKLISCRTILVFDLILHQILLNWQPSDLLLILFPFQCHYYCGRVTFSRIWGFFLLRLRAAFIKLEGVYFEGNTGNMKTFLCKIGAMLLCQTMYLPHKPLHTRRKIHMCYLYKIIVQIIDLYRKKVANNIFTTSLDSIIQHIH